MHTMDSHNIDQPQMNLIESSLAQSKLIDALIVEHGALKRVPQLLRAHFKPAKVFMVSDENTMKAAGKRMQGILAGAGIQCAGHVFPGHPRPKADVALAEILRTKLQRESMVPVAVGSGVINDLLKYCAFQIGTPYLCLATAASMDGYASMSSSLSQNGFKHSIPCAPPRVIVADLEVICKAPKEMNAWGYGDMAGKLPAGGDWLIADCLGIEPLDDVAWPLISKNLRNWLDDPAGVAEGDPAAIKRLVSGLAMAGIAMELHQSSRPASGADHQLAHMWEMDGLKHNNQPVSHGTCVALGTLTILALYDWLLEQDLSGLKPGRIIRQRKSLGELEKEIIRRFPLKAVAKRVLIETRHKYPDDQALRQRIANIRDTWPKLSQSLKEYLPGFAEMKTMLQSSGVCVIPKEIGITADYHKQSLMAARLIRRRYTVLDLLEDAGLFDQGVESCFSNPAMWS
jgi:glycerol-1-phosphate dehydrogenase [NAD(P)+]